MLMAKGEMIYYGSASDAIEYFAALGHDCPRNYNPADFLLDLVSMNSMDVISSLSNVFRESYKASSSKVQNDFQYSLQYDIAAHHSGNFKKIERSTSSFEREDLRQEYATYWIDQLWVLARRTMLNNFRNPSLIRLQYLTTVILGFLMGLIFYRLSYDARGTQDRFGVLFFIISLLTFSTMSSIDLFFHDRAIFVRERATGMYSTSAYFIVKSMCDIIPMRVIPAILLGAIPYYMMNLHNGLSHFLTFLSVMVLLSVVAVSLCFAISTLAPSVSFANLLAIISMLFNMLFGGFLINKATLPIFINWLQYTSFLNYAFEILCVNEFIGVTVNFNPVGYPIPPTPIDGSVFLVQFDMSPERVKRDFLLLGVMASIQLLVAYLVLRFYIKERR